jgi:SAM-dependent methyltransferase
MCNESCILFGAKSLSPAQVNGRKVLEVGSRGVGLRPLIVAWGAGEYCGVDARPGPSVDRVLRVEDLAVKLGPDQFDMVISTEMLEHVEDWQSAIANIKQVCRRDGLILITTRSPGFRIHGAPADFWRFTPDDMRTIFSDCDILALESDPQDPGVFILARNSRKRGSDPPAGIKIYSVITRRPEAKVPESERRSLGYRIRLGIAAARDILEYLSKTVFTAL